MPIFIKELQIQNFRCFVNEKIKLHLPDGLNEGSGLNVIVGENGNGKTTILESINYLTLNKFSSDNKLQINDFNDINDSIDIHCITNDFKVELEMPYKGYFDSKGVKFVAKSRDRKEPGKLLSKPFQINNSFIPEGTTYKNAEGADTKKTIPSFFIPFDNGRIKDDDINLFYFDKNRTRQISTGNYKTTFEKICDDFNWKFVKDLNPQNIDTIKDNMCGEYFKTVSGIAQKGAGAKIASELQSFFNNDLFKDLKIEFLDLLHPYTNSFFALRHEKDLKQIATKDLGSGIEIILTLLLLKSIAGESKGSLIYLIDEPELHLHPKAQEKLIEMLIKESKDKQVIISTHSPYIFKSALSKKVGLIITTRDKDGILKVNDANSSDWGALPWSPSWGEVNFHAYNLATIEFHNELYGYFQGLTGCFNIDLFDDYLLSQGLSKDRQWIKMNKGIPQRPKDITLPSYIRNFIHHPENKQNLEFSQDELAESIETLLTMIRNEK